MIQHIHKSDLQAGMKVISTYRNKSTHFHLNEISECLTMNDNSGFLRIRKSPGLTNNEICVPTCLIAEHIP